MFSDCRGAVVVIDVRDVEIDNKVADEFLVSGELGDTGTILGREDGAAFLCLGAGTGFEELFKECCHLPEITFVSHNVIYMS